MKCLYKLGLMRFVDKLDSKCPISEIKIIWTSGILYSMPKLAVEVPFFAVSPKHQSNVSLIFFFHLVLIGK